MPAKKLALTLIHNEKAGDGCADRAGLVALLERAGCEVDASTYDSGGVKAALDRPADIVAVAGGDGTISRVARKARPEGPAIFVLPVGTANNIAKSLGLTLDLEELVAGLRGAAVQPFYPIAATGPWGSRRLIEGIGFGAIEEAIADLPDKTFFDRARKSYADAVLYTAAEMLELEVEDETIVGKFSVLEVTTIPLVGPNLRLAAAADPSDRKFEICFIGDDQDQREALALWLDPPLDPGAAPMSLRTAEEARIVGRFRRVRLDGKVWALKAEPEADDEPKTIVLATEREPLPFLLPR